MGAMNITFGGVDLKKDFGLLTVGVSGIHDLAPAEVERIFLAGSSLPSDRIIRRELVAMVFDCVIAKDTHTDLIKTITALRRFVSPELGWRSFVSVDRPGERTFAVCEEMPIKFDDIPYYHRHVEFPLTFVRYPWWEDFAPTYAVDPALVVNDGHLPSWPVYSCRPNEILATGLSFTVQDKTFTYDGPLTNGDVLVVSPEALTVTLNDENALGHVAPNTDWPELVRGTNDIEKDGNFELTIAYRERYE